MMSLLIALVFLFPFTLGGMAEEPVLMSGQISNHEFLRVTISFDHDIVDGAPAARFTQRLRELIERGYGLENLNLPI